MEVDGSLTEESEVRNGIVRYLYTELTDWCPRIDDMEFATLRLERLFDEEVFSAIRSMNGDKTRAGHFHYDILLEMLESG
jgi:hypothetical protein|uniref:Uncharacterized protein n=1 Tax=Fagus sylvatica TaxID=28930 RepID=A0A2N9FXA7_FAGSY